jgi:hypothetical protein
VNLSEETEETSLKNKIKAVKIQVEKYVTVAS